MKSPRYLDTIAAQREYMLYTFWLLLLHPVYPGWCLAASTTTRWRSWWRPPPTPTSTTTATWSWPARSSPWPRPEHRRERCPLEMSPHSTFDDDIYNMIFILTYIYLYWQRLVFNKCCNHNQNLLHTPWIISSSDDHFMFTLVPPSPIIYQPSNSDIKAFSFQQYKCLLWQFH